jgi:hypothetical protein
MLKTDGAQPKEILLSSFLDSTYFIALETINRNFVCDTEKIHVSDKFIILSTDQSVFIFTIDGKFRNEIVNLGGGEGQYMKIFDFSWDDASETISVLDRAKQKIVTYNVNGEFVKEIKVGTYACSFIKWKGDTYIFLGSEPVNNQHFRVMSVSEGKQPKYFMPYDPAQSKYLHFTDVKNFDVINDTLHFSYSFCDTVYHLVDGQFLPRAIIDYGAKSLPLDFFHREYNDVSDFASTIRETEFSFMNRNYVETPTTTTFSFESNDSTIHVFQNKKTRSILLASGYRDDILFDEVKPSNRKTVALAKHHDFFVRLISAQAFKKSFNALKQANESGWRKMIASNPSLQPFVDHEDDQFNPVVFFYRVKEF